MSALRIGTRASSIPEGPAAAPAPAPGIQKQALDALGALVKWLPAEIVAGYAAVVTAMQPEQVSDAAAKPPNVSWAAWIIGLVATPILVFVAAWGANKLAGAPIRAALSVPAFALWSASIPHSVWEKWHTFQSNRPLFLFLLLIVVSVFTLVAQKLAPDVG